MDFRSATALPPHGAVSLPMMGHGVPGGVSSLLPPHNGSALFGLYPSSNGLVSLASTVKPPLPPNPALSTLTPIPQTSSSPSGGHRVTATVPPSLQRNNPLPPWTTSALGEASGQSPNSNTGGNNGASSFAAALRNLAKNATANTLDGEKVKRSTAPLPPHLSNGGGPSLGLPQTPIGTIAPTQMIHSPDTSAQASLLDVRKGFSSRLSTCSSFQRPDVGSLTTLAAAHHRPDFVSSGFQPYKPDTGGKGLPTSLSSPSSLGGLSSLGSYGHPSALAMHPSYASALMAAGYHPGLFAGSPLAAAYGFEAEAWYRSQLERYAIATGLAQPGRVPTTSSFPGLYSSSHSLTPTISTPSCTMSSLVSLPSPTSPSSLEQRTKDRDRHERKESAKREEKSAKDKSRDRSATRTPITAPSIPATQSSLSALLTAPPVTSNLPPGLANYPLHASLAPYMPPGLNLSGNASAPPNPSWEGLPMGTSHSPPKEDPSSPLHKGGGGTSIPLLPTQPLDISEVQHVGQPRAEHLPNPGEKRKFARPFEDNDEDIGLRAVKCAKLSDAKEDSKHDIALVSVREDDRDTTPKGSEDEDTATLHYNDQVVCVKPFGGAIVDVQSVKDENSNDTKSPLRVNLAQSTEAEPTPTPDDDKKFVKPNQEVLTKEKLKYLRYFRLVTHRKKNDIEGKPKGSTPEDTAHTEGANPHCRMPMFKEEPRECASFSLPIARAASCPMNVPKDSQNKVVFMSSLDLWNVPANERQDKDEAWSFILSERLARTQAEEQSPSLLYFSRLRESSHDEAEEAASSRTLFLHPKIEAQSPLTLEQQNTKLAQALVNGKPTPPLPPPTLPQVPLSQTVLPNINFSSLVPLPYQDMKAVDTSKSPPMPFLNGLTTTSNGSGTMSPLPPVPSPDLGSQTSSSPSPVGKKPKVLPWPGVEAVILSFKKHFNDVRACKKKLEKRLQDLQKEAIQQRNKVDALSTEMSGLVRSQKQLADQLNDCEQFREMCREVLEAMTQPQEAH